MHSKAIDIQTIFRPFTTIRSHQHTYPVDVEKMAKDFGLDIKRRPWPDRFVGAIGSDNAGYFIIVNQYSSHVQQRFTIAHEISHYILHKNQISPNGIKDDWTYHSHLSNTEESAASSLALTILMPADLLARSIKDNGLGLTPKDLPKLAEILQVSMVALSNRLGAVA